VPVNNFWSILVYDTQTRSMLQTDQEWPSVTSQDKHLTRNDDGSVDIAFGPRPPSDSDNWIQTLPSKRAASIRIPRIRASGLNGLPCWMPIERTFPA
jgi:hypothetical protein